MTDSNPDATFTIGAVSRLTGVPVDTLRVWERRYGGLAPARTSTNRRLYTQEDITRLTLIRQLVDQGHGVGTVAQLPESALRERLRLHDGIAVPPPERPEGKVPVLIYGEALPFLAEGWTEDMPGLNVVDRHTAYAGFEKAALDLKPSVLVAEWPTLTPEGIGRLHDLAQRVAARRAVAVYGFGMRETLDRARQLGVTTLRAPVTASALEAACLGPTPVLAAMAPAAAGSEVPPRVFDNETLGRLTRIPSRLRCECPHHLADLVFRLSAFEAYSLDCENRDDRDAALHAHLHRTTAEARALIEAALAHLIQVEEIDLGGLASPENVMDSLPV